MKQMIVVFVLAVALSALSGSSTGANAMPPQQGDGMPGKAVPGSTTGKVVETMEVGTYTYVQVDDGTKKIWAAAPFFAVAVGDEVVVPAGSPMTDFYSKTLERTFDLIYFVDGIKVVSDKGAGEDAAARAAAAHGAAAKQAAVPAIDPASIPRAEGGHTVAELFAKKAELTGKEVSVRGQVVKFNQNILGKNWIHLQDGSGAAGSNDLTVTTDAVAAVGDKVLVQGNLAADKDLGYGYKYEVIIENAKVTVE